MGVVLHLSTDITGLLRDFFVTEQTVGRDGFLQGLQPTGKLAGIALFVAASLLTTDPVVLTAFLVIPAAMAWFSHVPLKLLAARSVVVPAFSLIVVLPQLVLIDGQRVAGIAGYAITGAGVEYVAAFVLRVGFTVSLLSLLVLTTRFSALLASLRRFGIPPTLVALISITYRYLFLFFAELHRMLLARESRSFGRRPWRETWRALGALSGSFLIRTIERGERVQLAMNARGGDRPRTPYVREQSFSLDDVAFLAVALVALVVGGLA